MSSLRIGSVSSGIDPCRLLANAPMRTASFLTCRVLTLVLSGGRELAAALATAFVVACFAVHSEWRA